MRKIMMLAISCLYALATYGQGYDNLDFKSYKQANEILLKAYRLDYSSIHQLGYTLKGTWYYSGHYSTPEERIKVPLTSRVFASSHELMGRQSQADFQGKEKTMIEYFSADTSYVLHYDAEKCLYGKELKKDSDLIFYSPVTVLWDVQENHSSVRYLGLDSTSNCHVVSYLSSFYKQASVFIDKYSYTIKMVEMLRYSDIRGDYMLQYIYEDYERLGTHYLPSRLVVKEWGEVVQEMAYKHTQATRKKDSDVTKGYSYQRIGSNLYALSYPTGKHFSYVVDFGEYMGVVEAPMSSGYSMAAHKIVQGEFKHKPIKYLFLTHHHPDHAGGFAYYYRLGAKVVTTPLSQEYQQKLLRAEHSLCDDCYLSSGEGDFIAIQSGGEMSFSTESIKMEAYEFGDNGHTKEFILYYFPESKILIVGDLFYTPLSSTRASSRAEMLLIFIKEKGLDVELLYQTWSPYGFKKFSTFEDLNDSAKLYNEKQNQKSAE